MADIERKPCLLFAGFLPKIILVWFIFKSTASFAFQNAVEPDSVLTDSVSRINPDYKMLRGIFAAQSALYLGTIYGLGKSWYKNPLTKFSIKDDTHEWLQMDKLGHVYTSYQIARHTAAIYRKTGISKKQMLIYGAISGVIFQTPIEILDGFSPDYGFSPGDMVANITGSAIYLGQIALWDEVRIQPKFSFHYTSLSRVRPELLGSSRLESWLKDYNGQTYWLSFSPGSFFKGSGWPLWLCFSVGYGMHDMVSAEKSRSIELGYVPYRQYYLSLDIDLTKIKSRKKFVRTIGFLANSIKIPAPSLQFSKKGVAFKPFYF
ncbi:DUF2279 domain-containing protein [Dyadobacter sediminis]|uniref:DUF2279 domain-containing protein n=1 Tax=Dyadobacter sediminis TaxID=1493691 RepID=A0A5R9KEV0_9BACT|nr:DUF2279 domain-containing protein [Dyadobacter sediminis]TLU94633.1 DUF2279 domain-containing protein [Dyadobacter sediminis]GGB89568.1 DUF2279 domain-containing protein [Dyadobacter sediminis]